LKPDLDNCNCNGVVTINLDILETSSSIVLNVVDIKIHDIIFETCGSVITPKPLLSYSTESQTAAFKLHKTLLAGQKAKLTLRFTSKLNQDPKGFYRSPYRSAEGETKYVATTHLEPDGARLAFPCFDDVFFKAIFEITVITKPELVCLSNMESDSSLETVDQGSKRTTFKKTPNMCTYQLAIIIGDLHCHENNDYNLPVRVWATPDKNLECAVFPAQVAAQSLEFLEKQLACQYALPKLDLVAVSIMHGGAMEGWGLITCAQDYILLHSDDSPDRLRTLWDIITHEISHSWFGNHITFPWASYWLKEGLAVLLTEIVFTECEGKWNMCDSTTTYSSRPSLDHDPLEWSSPVEVNLKRASDIFRHQTITFYQKSACILHMIMRYVGKRVFLDALRLFLAKPDLHNHSSRGIWEALEAVSNKKLERIANSLAQNAGYPVVEVIEDEAERTLRVKQSLFCHTSDGNLIDDSTIHTIFLAVQTRDQICYDLILDTCEGEVKLDDLDFFKLNAGYNAFFYTLYATERLGKLAKHANDGLLDIPDVLGLYTEVFALVTAGRQATSDLLLLVYSIVPIDESVRECQVKCLNDIRRAWLFEQSESSALSGVMKRLIGHKITQSDIGSVGTMMANHYMDGDGTVKDEALTKFKLYMDGDRSAIEPAHRLSVFIGVLVENGEEEYDMVFKECQTARDDEDRRIALRSLGYATKKSLIDRTLQHALTLCKENGEDVLEVVRVLGSSRIGILARLAWMKENWHVLSKQLDSPTLGRVVEHVTESLTQSEYINDIENFFVEKNTNGFRDYLKKGLNEARSKRDWVRRGRDDVKTWLQRMKYL
jgi:aminopeptidase 2